MRDLKEVIASPKLYLALYPRVIASAARSRVISGEPAICRPGGKTNEDEALEVRAGAVCASGCVDDGSGGLAMCGLPTKPIKPMDSRPQYGAAHPSLVRIALDA